MSTEFRFPSYRLFPYERQLAFRELDRLGLAVAHSDIHRVVTDGRSTPYDLARLTYFGSVISDGTCIEPDVTVLERRHLERRATNGRVRQATRYSVHSFHEYKGKFHPHLVRAFANLIDVAPDELVVDPFCGSGTTLVESLLLGCDAVGVDLSPMATLISRAKIAALTDPDPSGLALRLKQWWESTSTAMASAQGSGRDVPVDGMPTASASYLRHWFTPPAYAALTVALRDLHVIRDDPALHLLTSVSLSTILRRSGRVPTAEGPASTRRVPRGAAPRGRAG